MKKVLVFLLAVTVNFFVGGLMFAAVGIAPVIGGIALNAVAVISPLFGAPVGVMRVGIFTEVWTGEMIKAFRNSVESIGWLAKIRDYSQYSNNDVIHFVNLGGDPTVLVNNTSYPLGIEDLSDTDKPIGLDKYQTKATRITDDELHAISYDKMGSVIERHREAIDQTKYARAIHALAPTSNSIDTPVSLTTGANSEDGTRKIMTRANLVTLKAKFDKMRVPSAGRILVLCSDHINDLLVSDQKFQDQYYNAVTGKLASLYGFDVYEYTDCPYFTVATKTKLAYGAVPGATERQASVAFFAPRMMRANGSTMAYLSPANISPLTQENLANFRTYFICLPLKNQAIAAIVSDVNA